MVEINTLRRLSALLKPGGTVRIVTGSGAPTYEIEQALKEGGFDVNRVLGRTPGGGWLKRDD